MKILKFKKTSKDKYKLFLDNNESITLYEDVIINNNLLLSKEVDNELLDDLIKQNNFVDAYNIALNYISVRMRSIYETKEYLIKKGISNTLIESTIKKLIKDGYLDDLKFTKAFVNDKLTITNQGPSKIKRELLKYKVEESIINEVTSDIDNDIVRQKLSKLVEKQVKIKKGSTNILKIKLVNYFMNLGYSKDMILKELSKYELKSDENKLKRDYDKIYNKYKDKYEGSKLSYYIAQKLYTKGYTSSDITTVIKDNFNH